MCVVQMHASRVSVFSRLMWISGFCSERAKLLLRAFANLVQLKSHTVSLWSLNLQNTLANMFCTKSYSLWLNYVTLVLCCIFTLFSFSLWKIPLTPVCVSFHIYHPPLTGSVKWLGFCSSVEISCVLNLVFV